jgi:AraC-like DNA-binding protein
MKEKLLEYFSKTLEMNKEISHLIDKNLVVGKGKLLDMYCQPHSIKIPEHKHNYLELIYMYRGSTVHVIDGTHKVSLKTYDLLLIRKGTLHTIEPADKDTIAVHFFILPEFFLHPSLMVKDGSVLRHFIVGSTSGNNMVKYFSFHLQENLPAQNLLENMIWSFMGDKKNRQEINQSTMRLLIMELMCDIDKAKQNDMAEYEEQIVLTAYQYLEDNYSSATLEAFSMMAMQPSYCISRLFKKYFQMTFKECLQLIRLSKAANLLATTSKPVEEIIADIGYENCSYFHKLFKNRYGITPKKFRDKTRKQI